MRDWLQPVCDRFEPWLVQTGLATAKNRRKPLWTGLTRLRFSFSWFGNPETGSGPGFSKNGQKTRPSWTFKHYWQPPPPNPWKQAVVLVFGSIISSWQPPPPKMSSTARSQGVSPIFYLYLIPPYPHSSSLPLLFSSLSLIPSLFSFSFPCYFLEGIFSLYLSSMFGNITYLDKYT